MEPKRITEDERKTLVIAHQQLTIFTLQMVLKYGATEGAGIDPNTGVISEPPKPPQEADAKPPQSELNGKPKLLGKAQAV
jgi:hypothetical protein